jgi:hypothetical protein
MICAIVATLALLASALIAVVLWAACTISGREEDRHGQQ